MNVVAEAVKEHLLKPLLRRVGTVVAAFLVARSDWACEALSACGLVTDNGAATVVAYLIGVLCLAYDLLVSWADKRLAKAKAASAALAAVRSR